MRDYRIGRLKGRFVVMWNDDDGTRRRYRLAAHTAKEAEREARDAIIKHTAPRQGITVAQIWDAYKSEMKGRRQESKMEYAGRSLLPALGHLSPDHLSIEDSRKYIADRRAAGRKDATIRSELGCLRTALKWASMNRTISIVPRIELPQTPPPRERYLSHTEVTTLLEAAAEPHIKLAMLLMLTTAGRIGALLELTWDRVDFDRRLIKLATNDIGPKKGRATVPMNDTLMAALKSAQETALSRYVIEWGGGQVKSIKTGFNAAVKRAGIAHCTPHDLRRTAGRFMVEAGVDIEEVAQYLGHTNPNVTRSTYARFSPEYLRKASDALEFLKPRTVQ
ncbi:tyrosine-type recombinase/integrase [Paracoccus onubensis]|uniref:Site-specific integrase n=1 Tax=Paracoccus onubensis TaxID=1675788 RepID=A0A418SQ51_9RHOB|nr:site-specific integrase [Paracoccus onubensis]RJE82967.1 site-specific integrase [Paracoccus onubensis]